MCRKVWRFEYWNGVIEWVVEVRSRGRIGDLSVIVLQVASFKLYWTRVSHSARSPNLKLNAYHDKILNSSCPSLAIPLDPSRNVRACLKCKYVLLKNHAYIIEFASGANGKYILCWCWRAEKWWKTKSTFSYKLANTRIRSSNNNGIGVKSKNEKKNA